MRGKVLGVDGDTGLAQIAGDDGRRYAFAREDWKQPGSPRIGLEVDFDAQGERALSVFGVGGLPATAEPREHSDKNRFIAALLAFFLGMVGVHKFYLGKSGAGLTMLLCGTIGWLLVLPGLFVSITAFVEFIIYLMTDDEEFDRRYVYGDRNWF